MTEFMRALRSVLRVPLAIWMLVGAVDVRASEQIRNDQFDLADAPSRGATDATITIVEFSDFHCPYCARAASTMDAVSSAYAGRVRWVFKHFPLPMHPDAALAHRAALAAGAQGKFWEMHDAIFTHRAESSRDGLIRVAVALGLDRARFVSDLDDESRHSATIQRDTAEGRRAGVDGTPTFFVNGRRLVGAQPFEAFKAAIDGELGRAATGGLVRPPAGGSVPALALDASMSFGPVDAPVTVRWFADFGSPLHRDAVALLKRVVAAHPNDVRVVFSHRPLEGRPEARRLHEAALAAAEQGKFWEVHDLLVARPLQDGGTLATNVARLGVDRAWFEEAVASGRARMALDRHLSDAHSAGVRGTPTFFVNGFRIDGIVSPDVFESVVSKELSRTNGERGRHQP